VIPELAATQFLVFMLAADSLCPAIEDLRAPIGEQTAQMNQVVHARSLKGLTGVRHGIVKMRPTRSVKLTVCALP
jgi:hypothetical protein